MGRCYCKLLEFGEIPSCQRLAALVAHSKVDINIQYISWAKCSAVLQRL
jgi:hypothetical protein